jgi:hypothetical protein
VLGRNLLKASFAASHFFDFSSADLEKVDPSVLRAILRDSGLIVGSEDALFEMIQWLGYISLLEFVHFEFLSSSSICSASKWISSQFKELSAFY